MPKAKKLASGNWRVLVYAGKNETGKRQYKSFTDPDKKKAEYAAAEYSYKKKRTRKSENLTFDEAANKYLESKSNLLSPSTIRGYRIMQRTTYTLIKDICLGKLEVGDFIQKQINQNALKYSSKSLKNQFGFISAVMRYHKMQVPDTTLKPDEHKSILVPTQEDAQRIMKIIEGTPIECQVLLALTCSLRQSEIAALTAFDIKGAKVYIHGALISDEHDQLVYKPFAKSDAGTRVDLMPPYLAQKMKAVCKLHPDGWLFQSRSSQVLKQFKNVLKENGLPPYTMHSLRHCFAAIMHARGVPDKYVMDMGGWASDHVLKSVYQYTFKEETEKIKKEANQYFENALNK